MSERASLSKLLNLKLPARQRRLLDALLRVPGAFIPTDDLLQATFGGERGGVYLHDAQVLLAGKLRRLGWTIATSRFPPGRALVPYDPPPATIGVGFVAVPSTGLLARLEGGTVSKRAQIADRIEPSVCGCPNVHLALKDSEGRTFATASMAPEVWLKVKNYVDAQLAVRATDDGIGACEGHG